MNLPGLKTFIAILETGSLVKASERLHVSQSTITARLKTLESELGQTLFKRDKSGVSLTGAGARFRRYAETMVDLWRQAKQETSLPDGVDTIVNLGCHIDLWLKTGHPFMQRLRMNYPKLALSAWPGKHAELDEWMSTGLCDAILTYKPNPQDRQTAHFLFDESLVLVSDRPHTPSRFDPEYIYVDAGEDFGRRHTAVYADAGIAKVSFGCASWALDFILTNGGSAYLPKVYVEAPLKNRTLFRVAEAPVFQRAAFLVVNDDASKNWQWLGKELSQLSEPSKSDAVDSN
ncbi:MAG: LysR family transcriptional regulator [Pseudomonadota bacterium]